MEKDQTDDDSLPSSSSTMYIPDNFFWEIAGPYNDKLRKHSIYPEHHKAVREFAKVMEMFFRCYTRERLIFGQPCGHANHGGQHHQCLIDDKQKPVDSRIPLRLKR